ncbi:MAG: DUF2007 domain-containing protein [Clostridiales bacterium]|nr:DUF2007 domain-containing protein [Clostridiales bacterium]
MYYIENQNKEWRGGVYLCTANSSFEADILESKLRGEDVPCVKKYRGASNSLEIIMGQSTIQPIDIYVPERLLEDARNIVEAIPLDDCEPVDFEE